MGISDLEISFVLVETESDGNIGSIARVMKNFGYSRLILFNPQKDPLSTYAHGFAQKGFDVIQNARIVYSTNEDSLEELKTLLQQFDIVIGTSAKGYSYKNIKRIPIFLNDLDLTFLSEKTKVAIVFGRESTGLTNDEVGLMDFLIKIPVEETYPTLNISQALGIVAYHLYIHTNTIEHIQVRPATKEQKDNLLETIQSVVEKCPIPDSRNERVFQAFKNIIGRSFASQKELNLLHQFFNKTGIILKDSSIEKTEK